VSRKEIADTVKPAFGGPPASTESLIATAQASGARHETLALLATLPATHFRSIRELWAHFPDVPVN